MQLKAPDYNPLQFLLLLSALAIFSGCSSTPSSHRRHSMASVATPVAATLNTSHKKRYFTLPSQQHAQEMVLYALGLLGNPYRFGGHSPTQGFDCSGLLVHIVHSVSAQTLPRRAASIAKMTRTITRQQLRPGDLVFFNTSGKRYSHVGLYIGDKQFVHAPSSGGKVRLESLHHPYFAKRIDGFRRLVP